MWIPNFIYYLVSDIITSAVQEVTQEGREKSW